MKVNDIIIEGKDLNQLKAAIEQGTAPTIVNARGVSDGWAWGDLQKLGWASKSSTPTGRTTREERWTYTGPNQINLSTYGSAGGTRPMQTGDSTNPVEVDYD